MAEIRLNQEKLPRAPTEKQGVLDVSAGLIQQQGRKVYGETKKMKDPEFVTWAKDRKGKEALSSQGQIRDFLLADSSQKPDEYVLAEKPHPFSYYPNDPEKNVAIFFDTSTGKVTTNKTAQGMNKGYVTGISQRKGDRVVCTVVPEGQGAPMIIDLPIDVVCDADLISYKAQLATADKDADPLDPATLALLQDRIKLLEDPNASVTTTKESLESAVLATGMPSVANIGEYAKKYNMAPDGNVAALLERAFGTGAVVPHAEGMAKLFTESKNSFESARQGVQAQLQQLETEYGVLSAKLSAGTKTIDVNGTPQTVSLEQADTALISAQIDQNRREKGEQEAKLAELQKLEEQASLVSAEQAKAAWQALLDGRYPPEENISIFAALQEGDMAKVIEATVKAEALVNPNNEAIKKMLEWSKIAQYGGYAAGGLALVMVFMMMQSVVSKG